MPLWEWIVAASRRPVPSSASISRPSWPRVVSAPLFRFAGSRQTIRKSSLGGSRSLEPRISAISADQRNWFSM